MTRFVQKGFPAGSTVRIVSVTPKDAHMLSKVGQTMAPRYVMTMNGVDELCYNVDIPYNGKEFCSIQARALVLVALPERVHNWCFNKIRLMLDPSSINFQKIQQQLIDETKNG